jgi:nitroimidazol reductase NimA-like FMN-containing flavoprotein (pyridoxamine 5'-phosphate oxidase superfamily)
VAMKLKKSMARLIEWERVCRVATVGEAGVPHVVPVCHILDDGKIYFATGRSGRKVLNLRANPRVAVVVDLYSDAWPHLKGAMVQGTAKLIDKGPRFRRIRAMLYRKYAQYQAEAAISESDSVIVEVTPTRAFAWGLD